MSVPNSQPTPKRGARHRRGLRLVVLVALVAVAAWTAAAGAMLLSARQVPDDVRADAVVVLAGSWPRAEAGLMLHDRGAAPALALSDVGQHNPFGVTALCHDTTRPEVRCFSPEPETTHGEARAIGALADQEGWESLAVVTTWWHVPRARVLVRQCYEGEMTMVGIDAGESWQRMVGRVLREWIALPAAMTVRRAC